MMQINLSYLWTDEEYVGESDEQDNIEINLQIEVEEVSENLFRSTAPVSLTFAGPLGPMLDLGTVFSGEPQGNGKWRFVRVEAQPPVCTKWWTVREEVMNNAELVEKLRQLWALGCRWEWCVGNLIVQAYKPSGGMNKQIQEALDQLAAVLVKIV